MIRVSFLIAAVVVASWAFAPPVQAYLDPGAGSILLQSIVGGIAIVGGLVAHYWGRVRHMFRLPDRPIRRSGTPNVGAVGTDSRSPAEAAHPDA